MTLNNINDILKIYAQFTPLILLDKYSPDKSFDNKIIRILSMYIFYITGCIGIILCVILHRILYEIFENKYNTKKELLNEKSSNDILADLSNSFVNVSNHINNSQDKKSDIIWNIIIDGTIKEELYYDDLIKSIITMDIKYCISYIDDIYNIDRYLYTSFRNKEIIVLTDIRNQPIFISDWTTADITFIDINNWITNTTYIKDLILNKIKSKKL